MRILLAMMIPNPFARPITAWITVFVILLHGVTVWAMVSMDSPPPLTDTSSINAIEVEFITLSQQPKKPPQSKQLKESTNTNAQPKAVITKPAQPNAPPTLPWVSAVPFTLITQRPSLDSLEKPIATALSPLYVPIPPPISDLPEI